MSDLNFDSPRLQIKNTAFGGAFYLVELRGVGQARDARL